MFRRLPHARSAIPAMSLATALLGSVTTLVAQGAWPEYRGPSHDGHATAKSRPPLTWSEAENVRWKTAIAGQGWSSPVVWKDRIWLTTATADGRQLSAIAVDAATGKIVVDRVIFEVEEPASKNALNSYASPSPVLDEDRAYVHFGSDGTACLDAETGETLWQRRDLNCDHMEGAGSSPFLDGDLLIFNVDGGDVQYVVALDKRTGETRWKTDRTVDLGELPPDLRKAYSTPILIEVDGHQRLISSGAEATVAYDPVDGKELWSVRHKGFSMSSRPLFKNGLLFLNTGFMRARLLAVRAAGTGDVTDTNVVWSYTRNVPKMPSPVLVDDRLYMVSDNGIATCLDPKNGEQVWRERLGSEYCASPLVAAGRLYFFDREGRTIVLAPGDEHEELARNQLDAGFMASPAVLGDALILRTRTHLYRIEAD